MPSRLDLRTWKRREHFALFRAHAQPFFAVTVEVDVTELRECCRESNASFFLGAIFCLLHAANATEALRLRLRGDEVWLHDRVGLGTPIMRDDETFAFARFDPEPAFATFHEKGAAAIARVKGGQDFDPMPGQDDLLYHSTLPWLRFTSFTNALTTGDSIPRLTFGRVTRSGERETMPFAVEVHHALVDGLDVGRLVERFETNLRDCSELLRS